jgi:hypothetical protein
MRRKTRPHLCRNRIPSNRNMFDDHLIRDSQNNVLMLCDLR